MKRNLVVRGGVALCVATLALPLVASAAFAQTSTTATAPSASATGTVKPAPLATGIYQVQVAPEVTAGQAALIVAVQLPPNTKLPAMVRIPVPQRAVPTWAGEILGGDPTQDPQRPYRTVQGVGGQVLEMTLEQTRSAQAEFSVPSTSSGGRVTVNVTWIQAALSKQTEFSVRMPSGVSQVQITPTPEGSPVANALGETLYALPTQTMKPGSTSVIVVGYTPGQGAQQGQTGAQSSGTSVLWILVGLLVVVLAIIGFVAASKRSRQD